MSSGTSESWTLLLLLETGEKRAGSSWIRGVLFMYGGGGRTGIGRLIPAGKLGTSTGPEASIGTGCIGHGGVMLVLELASPYTGRSTPPNSLKRTTITPNQDKIQAIGAVEASTFAPRGRFALFLSRRLHDFLSSNVSYKNRRNGSSRESSDPESRCYSISLPNLPKKLRILTENVQNFHEKGY
jgi:hypothetical protein